MTFDMENAREICTRIKGYEDPDAGNLAEFEAAALFPAALDRILELESANRLLADRMAHNAHRDAAAAEIQAARIGQLEEALVEERARRICHDPRADKVGHWPRYERVVVDESRQQLRSEGKI